MSHEVEVLFGIVFLVAYMLHYRWSSGINDKIGRAERMLSHSDEFETGRVSRLFREEWVAIRAVAKQKHMSDKQLAFWVKTRLLNIWFC